MGLIPVPNDQLATVVTTLEMTERPKLRPLPASPLRLVRWPEPSAKAYQTLFRRVGGPWLWFSRLAMDEGELLATIRSTGIEIYAVTDRSGVESACWSSIFDTRTRASYRISGLFQSLPGSVMVGG